MKTSFKENISKEEINNLPIAVFKGTIVIIDSVRVLKKYLPELMLENIWGIDTETKPCFKKGVQNQNKTALIQLCGNRKAFLFRVNKIGIPDVLVKIFSDEKILKVGLALKDDIAGLENIRKFKAQSFIDLQKYVNDFGIEANGLRSLSAIVLGIRISKTQQLSNWEADVLDEKQILYAATDAWAPRQIYLKLQKH
ncbi:MAG TPA: 3'-5' exonuclease [Bacteroidales bacterium]|jgi:ribonuclease D|nr:3'-5' exonuclease domain-containing protein 2 [Bacteroidales bacterium]MDD4236171.1 3'-5' exonuclease domain-containing protein 2 [Bacteroidales bacterium]MDY0159956.1 3'-5' exonuclease [Bacteroidales bacterium]HXK82238.1 3'-5' exonuclease [Bacteroidales bacterium]